jgi:hypothetical protein
VRAAASNAFTACGSLGSALGVHQLDRLMVALDFQADLNCLQARARAAPSWRNLVLVGSLYVRNYSYQTEANMGFGRGILLWILGVPIPIIILLALFWHN